MNWVGGSRSRLVMKNDAKRQREFFEKRKMQQRLKNLGVTVPASPQSSSAASMDLVTLFIVNQIAAKKENKEPPKVAVLGSYKGGSKHKRNEPLVLPMSPCSPSQLSFVESQTQNSLQATRKRKHVIPQGFKCRQLSPVPESGFSDNSASDYLPPITDPLSPFSSTSSASSGMFPLQLNLQQRSQTQAALPPDCSPLPWNTSGLEPTKEYQPFSQPRGMTNRIPWSCGSNLPIYQLETPTAARVLFRSPEPDNTEARDHERYDITFSLNQPDDRQHMLNFTLNQSETEQQIEEADVFRGFSTEECEREATPFGRGKSKIYLKDETPVKSSTPQTFPDSPGVGLKLSNCTDMNFSCLEHNNGPMNGCDYSPSYSCRGYLSSDDEEERCEPCLQAASSYINQTCCSESLKQNLDSQGNTKQRHTQPRPLSLLLKPKTNFRDDQIMENVAHPDKALGCNGQQMESNTAQLDFPLAQTQSPEPCKCKKTSNETRDAGSQTVDPTAETCDASTQCSFVADSATKTTEFNLCLPPVDVSVQHSATGGQTDTATEPNTHTPSSSQARSGGRHTPWSKNISKAGSLSGSGIIKELTADNRDGKVILQRPITPFLDALSMTDSREGRDERGQQENGCLMKGLSNRVREEVTSVTRVNRLSQEAETLQEIADILLLLKQKEK
ncbi:uncharacterized protein LOC127358621 isoform X2 [Dicentrarchus labrax]|uniref:uncharacterized protein LOC127358621 isoform X2 n=1 Tax=Dicentrarchus labrax TaxID=13489 RepID=UPI0021F67407|nr:uncharacterized protein LOC127358621 isoform X2 [Dicentrarchus labrax]